MSRYTHEEIERHKREIRATLARLNDQEMAAKFEMPNVRQLDEPEPARPWGSTPDMHNAGGALPLLPNTSMDKWRAEAAETEHRRQREREARDLAQEKDRWMATQAAAFGARRAQAAQRREIDAAISAALNCKDHDLFKTLVEIIVRLREERHAEIKEALGELRAELAEYGRRGAETVKQLRREIAVAKAHDDGGRIVDLPKGSWKRHVA
jgi:hypothetical protein